MPITPGTPVTKYGHYGGKVNLCCSSMVHIKSILQSSEQPKITVSHYESGPKKKWLETRNNSQILSGVLQGCCCPVWANSKQRRSLAMNAADGSGARLLFPRALDALLQETHTCQLCLVHRIDVSLFCETLCVRQGTYCRVLIFMVSAPQLVCSVVQALDPSMEVIVFDAPGVALPPTPFDSVSIPGWPSSARMLITWRIRAVKCYRAFLRAGAGQAFARVTGACKSDSAAPLPAMIMVPGRRMSVVKWPVRDAYLRPLTWSRCAGHLADAFADPTWLARIAARCAHRQVGYYAAVWRASAGDSRNLATQTNNHR